MVNVVVAALVVDGRVLLGLRSPDKHAYPDIWDLPGGVVEAGESEMGALGRELQEELGIQIATDTASLLCRVTVGSSDEPAHLSAWLVGAWDGTPSNLAPEEHVEIAWFGIEDLPPLALAHPDVREAVLGVLRARGR